MNRKRYNRFIAFVLGVMMFVSSLAVNNATVQAADYGVWFWPVPGLVKPSQYFSNDHRAVDIPGAIGTPVYAAKAGTVKVSINDCSHVGLSKEKKDQCVHQKYYYYGGNQVYIAHDDGTFSVYAHMLKGSVKVSAGSRVSAGQQIGQLGNSGSSTGPHLHFGVAYGGTTYDKSTKIDPMSLTYSNKSNDDFCVENTGVTSITQITARINAKLSPGVKIEKAGFYYGKSSNNMTKKSETVNAYTESIWYDLGTGKWCSALSSNTKYYYQIYVVINGKEYKSKLSTFTTARYKIKQNSDKFSNLKALDITTSSAKISTDYPKNTYPDAGFYFGTSADIAAMKKTSEYAHGGSPSVSYTNSYKLGIKYDGYGYKWAQPLKEGTKYYYAFYLVLDGTEYISPVKSFTTKGSASVQNVEMVSYPSKRDYVVGEKIDISGVKIKVTYSDGTSKVVTTGITVSGDASAAGTRQILLKYEGKTFTYNINVTQPLKSIIFNKTSASLEVHDILILTVNYDPIDTTDSKDVSWKSSNENVATVSKGMVTAVGVGTATITATTENGKTAACTVEVVPVCYNIKFNGNGATSGKMSTVKNVAFDKKVTLTSNAFKKKGYKFVGWNTKKNGKGTSYKNKQKVNGLSMTNGKTVTLYAQWKIEKYDIKYKLKGGKNNSSNPKTYTLKDSITLKKPTRPGYKFVGWYKDSKYKIKVTKIKKGSTKDITLYAKWKKK